MRRSLSIKLTLAVLVVGLTGAVLVALFAGRTTTVALRGFALEQSRLNFIDDVSNYYRRNGSLDGLSEWLHLRAQQLPPPRPLNNSQEGKPRLPPPGPPPRHVLADASGHILIAAPPYRPGQAVPPAEIEAGTPIDVDGQRIGTVLTNTLNSVADPQQQRYLGQVYAALGWGTIGATLAALLLGVILVRTLIRPLRELTQATQAVAQGNLAHQVPVRSTDELGQLAASFNRMSADLAEATRLRRQMTADIAHDLRSPLTVLTGYIESLRDGVLPPSPGILEVMHDEAQHLQHLVEDLRTLSLADAHELPLNRQPVPPGNLLERIAAKYAHQAAQQQVDLQVQAPESLPDLDIDPERLVQVLGNLVSNALRYTPAGGRITLSARPNGEAAILEIEDTGSGIDPTHLPHIFDRFYRADESRHQEGGESGLGLAIAKSIVEAHGGTLTAASEVGRGTRFEIILPTSLAQGLPSF